MNNRLAKRVSSLLLACCMALTLAVPAFAFSSPAELVSGCNADAWEVLRLTNKQRMAQGLQPLSTFSTLQQAANIRTEEVKTLFSHDRPNGTDCFTVLPEVGLSVSAAGENIAQGYQTPAAAMDGWMNSPGHRANILSGEFAHAGMGASQGSWVQLFLTHNCAYDSMEILAGSNGLTLPVGGSVDDLGAAIKLHCATHGDCYLPLSADMCTGANTASEGTMSVTVNCCGLSGSFQLTVSGTATNNNNNNNNNNGLPEGYVLVTLDAKGGSGAPESLPMAIGQPYGDLPAPTREGYQFDGWFDASGLLVTPDRIVTSTYNHTLVARWTKLSNTCKVTLTVDGGALPTGQSGQIEVTIGQPYGNLPTPTREGYRFDGWFDPSGNRVTAETPVTSTGDHALVAHWTKTETCVVTFDPGEGTLPAGTSAQATVTTGEAYGELPTPTRTGYRFDGWYNVSGEPVTSATVVTAVQAHTLVAKWTKIETTSGNYSNFSQKNTYASGQFTDVPADSWYANMVKTAYELGLVKGSSDTTYNPNGNITIVETLALACRLHSIYTTGSGDFTQGTPWYQVYVDYALANGIISSGEYSDYTATATRAQFASILAKALPADALTKINNVTSLPDVKTSDSFAEAVFALYNAGVLTGSDSIGTFNPQSFITRSEVATIVARMALPSIRRTLSL